MRTVDAKHFLIRLRLERDKVESFGAYPYCIPALQDLTELTFHPAVTFLVGENGSGKSTLLEAIAAQWGLNPEGGTQNFRFDTRPSLSSLHSCITLVKGDLRAVARARRLSRATMRNIRQNLFLAFIYNAVGVPVAAGILYPFSGTLISPIWASAAMTLSSVSVIGNALRLRRVRL